jgi:sulfur carrier protein
MSSPEPARDEILINGEPHPRPADGTLVALLAELDLTGKRIAVAINRTVVPRSERATCAVAAGDRVEILEAVGGG